MDRAVIHLNVADFASAVERVVDTRLRDRPVIVAPEAAARAAVYDMSNEAYLAGVRKGMALRRAIRLCNDAVVLPPRQDLYERAMKAFFKRALPYSPLAETGDGDGHVFVDATGTCRLFGPPMDLAWRLRREVRKDLGLDPIWSVAPNKLVAKVATRLVKPTGEYIVAAGEEESFLAPLPVYLIPGVEREDLLRLSEFNFTRVCQVAALSLAQLRVLFGNRSRFLYESMRGADSSPVVPAGQEPPKIVLDREFGDDANDVAKVEGALYGLAEKGGSRLRRRMLVARRVAVVIDYSDGLRCIRRKKADPPTANDLTLFDIAKEVLGLAWFRRVRIRHVRLICDRLIFPPARQLELFTEVREESQRRIDLVKAIDDVRGRFGAGVLRVGRTMAA